LSVGVWALKKIGGRRRRRMWVGLPHYDIAFAVVLKRAIQFLEKHFSDGQKTCTNNLSLLFAICQPCLWL
jgi:hypothetical protein